MQLFCVYFIFMYKNRKTCKNNLFKIKQWILLIPSIIIYIDKEYSRKKSFFYLDKWFIKRKVGKQSALGLAEEYGVSKASISIWTKQFREECQTNDEAQADYDYMKENLQLKKQLAELQKENDFLKKAAAFFAKEID